MKRAAKIRNAFVRQTVCILMICLLFSPGSVLGDEGANHPNLKATMQVGVKGHAMKSSINSIAFSPDGKALICAGDDKPLKLLDVESGKIICKLKGHKDNVESVAFSPNGKLIASGSMDNTVRLWDVENKKEIATLKGHKGSVWDVAFSPDGNTVASGSSDGTIKLWDIMRRVENATLKILSSQEKNNTEFIPWVYGLTLVGGKILPKKIDNKEIRPGIYAVAFNPDGRLLACASQDGTIRMWDVEQRTEVATLKGHDDIVIDIAFSSDGNLIISGGADNTVKLWDVEKELEIATLIGHKDRIKCVSFSPDGKLIASASVDRSVIIWDIEHRTPIDTFRVQYKNDKNDGGFVYAIAFSPDGRLLASGRGDGRVNLWDMSSLPGYKLDVDSYMAKTEIEENSPKAGDKKSSIKKAEGIIVNSTENISPPGSVSLRWRETSLLLDVKFVDPNANMALDADETATLEINLTNEGPGSAYDVQIDGSLTNSNPNVKGRLNENYSVIEPGTTVNEVMEISADEFVEDGNITIRLDAEDRYGRKAQPKEMTIETRKIIPPVLVVSDYGIDDDDIGDSYGDSNGKIGLGESIEVRSIIQNTGSGEANDVVVNVNYPAGVNYMGKSSYNLGDLAAGDYREITFAFAVPRNLESDGQLPFTLDLTESRGRFGSKEILELSLNQEQKQAGSIEPSRMVIAGKQNATVKVADAPSLTVDVDVNIPKTEQENRDGIAVVIGNRNYKSKDVPDVQFAIRDAAIIKEYLLNTLGYREGNIIYITDATTADFRTIFGTREESKGKLADYVKAGKSDVFIYYSGHGAPDVENKKGYFVPVDCDPNVVRLNGYSLDLFYKNLSQLQARSFVIAIDACFSGGSDDGMLISSASPVGIQLENPEQRLENAAVFTSSSADEISSWYPEKRHGLFTYFFLKGIQGAADIDRNGTISAGEINNYVSDITEGIPYWARRIHSRTQQPTFVGDSSILIRR